MEKPPDKKPPAGPMTLGNLRSLSPRSLWVKCKACEHDAIVNVDGYPDDMQVLGLRMRCRHCGHLGATVWTDWSQLRGLPGTPRR